MDLERYFDQWVEDHRQDLIRDITRLVAVPSVKGEAEPGAPFGPGPAQALHEALALCQEYGFATKNFDNYVGTASLNDQETVLDILGHLDVVDPGEGWDSDPYQAFERDGMLYGRGTDDDKGPVIASLLAMRAVRDSGIPLKYNARLIMGTDEESGSGDLEYYFARAVSAPNTFSPDASFPVYNTEKGAFRPRITKTWTASQALPRVSAFDGGFRFNVLPADAQATVLGLFADQVKTLCQPVADELHISLEVQDIPGGAQLHVTGTGSHAAEPETGNNGITALVRLLLALPLADCPTTRTLRDLDALLPHGDYLGRALGIAQADEISGYLTLSYTIMHMNETGFEGCFDSRVPVCANEANCKAVVVRRFGDLGYQVEGDMAPAHHTPADSPFVQTLLQCYEHYTGRAGECLSMGGGTYVHEIEGGVAFGAGMPGFASNLHSANEHISIQDMLTACKIFALVIAKLCMA